MLLFEIINISLLYDNMKLIFQASPLLKPQLAVVDAKHTSRKYHDQLWR